MQQLFMFTIKPRNEELDYSQKQREKKRSADNIIKKKNCYEGQYDLMY